MSSYQLLFHFPPKPYSMLLITIPVSIYLGYWGWQFWKRRKTESTLIYIVEKYIPPIPTIIIPGRQTKEFINSTYPTNIGFSYVPAWRLTLFALFLFASTLLVFLLSFIEFRNI